VGYDRWLKPTVLGPLIMGLCRAVNLLLGMSIASGEQAAADCLLAGFQPAQLVAAAGLGTYITGVTLFARQEAQTSGRLRLLVASAVLLTGIGFLSLLPDLLSPELRSNYVSRVPLLTAVLAVLIGWRCFRSVLDPSPRSVQNAIKVCLMSIIVLDAVICLCVSDAAHALGILSLLVPTIVLGKWFSPT
jgi:4-hydroxybenzoate polyprenyltransferase